MKVLFRTFILVHVFLNGCTDLIENPSRKLIYVMKDMFPMFKFFSNCSFSIKCIGMFETNQFIKLNHDPTKSVEGKVQRL